MKKILGKILFTFIVCFLLLQNIGFSQKRKNFLGYELESSFLIPTIIGLSYERHIIGKFALSIHANGIFQRNVQGFKASLEPRIYLGSSKDSTNLCKGWFVGIKPMYMFLHYPEYITSSYNGITNTLSPTVVSSYNRPALSLLVTFGRQWVWKSGLFLNIGIGAGIYRDSIHFTNLEYFSIFSPRYAISFNGDIAIRFGYAF